MRGGRGGRVHHGEVPCDGGSHPVLTSILLTLCPDPITDPAAPCRPSAAWSGYRWSRLHVGRTKENPALVGRRGMR